jgi:hypothetical protein
LKHKAKLRAKKDIEEISINVTTTRAKAASTTIK